MAVLSGLEPAASPHELGRKPNGRFPLLARIPDTIAARYQLIPCPDLYTTFHYNNDFGVATYFGDDGIHHTPAGEAKLIELWAEAVVLP